jgi:catechol 2,3-dioxygenase-like lactoylglutathione lyase family enzyme
MYRRIAVVVGCLAAGGLGLSAQIRALNSAGVAAGHEHLAVTNEAASTAFWSALGGTPEHVGTIPGVKFPGVYILFQVRAAPAAAPESSVGSVAESIGLKVKDLGATLAKLDTLGIHPEAGATPKRAVLMSPEKVRVVLVEDTALPTAVASNEVVMNVPDPAAAAAWYAKWFGATVVPQGQEVVAEIPGMNLRFVRAAQPAAGTRGRALDHLGFEVANLQAFDEKLQQGGVTINRPYGKINLGFLTGITFITDPWGTYIELNEGYVNGPK